MKKFKVLADPMLACIASILIICFTGLSLLFLWALICTISPSAEDRELEIAFCVTMILGAVIVSLLLVLRGYVSYVFSAKEIMICAPFRKPTTKPYWQFPYIERARYRHIGIWREFIVFTSKHLTIEELNHINNVACGENLIKVRYSDRTYQKLCAVLPPKPLSALKHLFPDK